MKEIKTKRIHIIVPTYLHELLKIESAHQRRSMTKILISSLLHYLMQCEQMPEEVNE